MAASAATRHNVRVPSGRLVLLNGPPSCGKTSLAVALREAVARPWFHRSLDDFRQGYLPQYWLGDDGSLFRSVMAGYLGALRSLTKAGSDVIAEAVMTRQRRASYVEALDSVEVVLVGVRCDLVVARQREQQRTDRLRGPMDLPAAAFEAVHEGLRYDIEVDTTNRSAVQLAAALAPQIGSVHPTAFDLVRSP